MTKKTELIEKAQKLGIKTDGLTIAKLEEAIAKKQETDQKDFNKKTTSPLREKPIKNLKELSEKILGKKATPKPSSKPKKLLKKKPNTTDKKLDQSFAKAGKRSQKNVEANKAEQERQARKLSSQSKTSSIQPTQQKLIKSTRSRLQRRSKKYRQVFPKVDKKKNYETKEALELIIQTSTTKFDSSVDISVGLGVDVKQTDHNIRDYVVLPAGTGKNLRIAVFAEDKEAQQALQSGADIAGRDVFLQQLDKGILNFDVLITMPNLMVELSKYAKMLGPKGLMPNLKSGTITKDIPATIEETRAGRTEYRVNENGIISLSIGKVSFGTVKLLDNFQAVLSSIKDNKPTSLKGSYIKTISVSTTMGPSLKIATSTH
ncbi:MAG: 50S ribosomal protein L1 [Candidatus Saccharibacteria bacterium]|nr:50S ribosomal protein L1 [Candidatus Saccharibacteria bacterium]